MIAAAVFFVPAAAAAGLLLLRHLLRRLLLRLAGLDRALHIHFVFSFLVVSQPQQPPHYSASRTTRNYYFFLPSFLPSVRPCVPPSFLPAAFPLPGRLQLILTPSERTSYGSREKERESGFVGGISGLGGGGTRFRPFPYEAAALIFSLFCSWLSSSVAPQQGEFWPTDAPKQTHRLRLPQSAHSHRTDRQHSGRQAGSGRERPRALHLFTWSSGPEGRSGTHSLTHSAVRQLRSFLPPFPLSLSLSALFILVLSTQ